MTRVCVVGAGVVGLATAENLRKQGYDVIIISESHPLDFSNPSQGAGGFWEPFKCEPQELVNKWASETLAERYLPELKEGNPLVEAMTTLQLHNNTNPAPGWSDCNPYLDFKTVTTGELPSLGRGKGGSYIDPKNGLPTSNFCWDPASVPSGWSAYSHAWLWHTVRQICRVRLVTQVLLSDVLFP